METAIMGLYRGYIGHIFKGLEVSTAESRPCNQQHLTSIRLNCPAR